MTAIIVTPDIVLTVFLRKIGISFLFSSGFSCCMSCELGGIVWSLCLLAICILIRFKSFFVGFGIFIRRVMISLLASLFMSCSICMIIRSCMPLDKCYIFRLSSWGACACALSLPRERGS